MSEYIVKLKISTDWHAPYYKTSVNYDTSIYTAPTAKEAVRKAFGHYRNLMNHPNKSFELVSVEKVG